MIVQLHLPGTPPSLNQTGASRSWQRFYREKKKWEGYCMIALLEMKVPKGLARVEASALLRFASKRRRDEGNFRVVLEKALGDALQLHGAIADDTPEQFSFGKVAFDEEKGDPLTIVELEFELPGASNDGPDRSKGPG